MTKTKPDLWDKIIKRAHARASLPEPEPVVSSIPLVPAVVAEPKPKPAPKPLSPCQKLDGNRRTFTNAKGDCASCGWTGACLDGMKAVAMRNRRRDE